jgi:hypothetical protein
MVHRERLFLPAPREIQNFGQYYSTPHPIFPLFPEKKSKKAFDGKKTQKTSRASARAVDKFDLFYYNRID